MPTRTTAFIYGCIAAAGVCLLLSGCNADNGSDRNVISQTRSSLYDPMKDAAPGDELPAAPSISSITPAQVMGNGNDDTIVSVPAAGARR